MGLVSTNVAFIVNGSGSGSGGSTVVDLPTHIKSLSANGGNKFVTLSLEYENTDYVSGVQVNYKTGDYPTSPSDGDSLSVDGAPTSIKVEGLTNKLEYYFRVFLFREVDGVKHHQTDITNAKTTCIPRAVEIIGATPIREGDDYLVFDAGCTFTITAPAGTRLILGDGGQGGGSGDYYSVNGEFPAQDGSYGTASTLKINGQTYNTTGTYDVVTTKAGPIGGGGQGGQGGEGNMSRESGVSAGDGGSGGNGGAAFGPGGQGGRGGSASGSAKYGGKGGQGGANGAGTKGATGSNASGSSGGYGGTGAAGKPKGIYSYGGDGGIGYDGYYDADEYKMPNGGQGGRGGRGGNVRTFVLPETVNATVILTIGKGGKGHEIDSYYNDSLYEGQDGGNGVLVIEW